MSLKTNYKDSSYTQKRYRMTQKSSGYYTLEDVTDYSVEGDYYGCEDLNKQNYAYNQLESNFNLVQALLTKLRNDYGMTVSNNPESIVNAINLLASNQYNAGRSSGISYVQNHATSYGLRTSAEYGALTSKVQTAYNYMATAIPYNNIYNPISGSFSDPITSAEANAFHSTVNSAIDGVRTPYTTFKTTADSYISGAVSALTV